MDQKPRLRNIVQPSGAAPYPLNEPTKKIIQAVGQHFIYRHYVGAQDLSGSDWTEAFCDAIGGEMLSATVGIADVGLGRYGWSLKTIKRKQPSQIQKIRIIVGRCSPDYSYGITDPHVNITKTGKAVLGILNARISLALDAFPNMRNAILIRSLDLRHYVFFEEEVQLIDPQDYTWKINVNGNFIATNKKTNEITFTWQPHGSQLTQHMIVPSKVTTFSIDLPTTIGKSELLAKLGVNENWVKIY